MWVVLTVGLILGLAHAAYVYPVVMVREGEIDPVKRPSAISYVAWTLLLWIVFGFYVIGIWLIGSVLYLLFKAFR